MNIAEKIQKLTDDLVAWKDATAELVAKADGEDRDLSEDDQNQIEEYAVQIEAGTEQLASYKRAEAAIAAKAVKASKGLTVGPVIREKEDAGALLFKMAHVHLRALKEQKTLGTVIRERYSSDDRVAAVAHMTAVNKAATEGATTEVSGWAAELVEDQLSGFVNLLQPISIYGPLSSAGTAIPFGNANSITVPNRANLDSGATPDETLYGRVAGSFVEEGSTIPVKQDLLGSTTFNRFKLAVITVFTNELARVSNPQIEGLLRDAILDDTAITIDAHLMDAGNGGVVGLRPASPWNGASTQASAGDTLADILTDLRFLMDTLSNANAGRAPRIVINPARLSGLSLLTNANGSFVFRDEIAQGRLMGIPLIVSTNCPSSVVYIIDAADFGTAFGSPEFEASQQATLVMADDTGGAVDPYMSHGADAQPGVDGAGSLHVASAGVVPTAAKVQSMFQTWSTALRMIMPISWGTMRAGTRAYLTGVSW